MKAHAARALQRVRKVALALPETNERPSHGAPTFFVRDKKTFATFIAGHHDDERIVLWFAAPPGAQATLIARDPQRFFRPPYVGHRGWTAIVLEGDIDWIEVGALIEDAYCEVAPATLIRQLGARTVP